MNRSKISKNLSKFSKKELDSFFRHATRVFKSQAFTILTSPAYEEFSKVLLVVPKKYGNAPARNLIKRRLKNIFWQEKLYEQPNNVAFIIRPDAKKLSFQELKEICLKILS